jgi:hypothetical protein
VRRARRILGRLVVLAAVVTIVVALVGKLPSGTGGGSLAMRAATGAASGVLLVAVVRRSMGAFGDAGPTPPPTIDARPADVVYVCPVCGTRLRLEVAATGKAPRHCGEEMEARLG